MLDHVHRQSALENWMQLHGKEEISYEHGLASFDLFILHDRLGDRLEVRPHILEVIDCPLADCSDYSVRSRIYSTASKPSSMPNVLISLSFQLEGRLS